MNTATIIVGALPGGICIAGLYLTVLGLHPTPPESVPES